MIHNINTVITKPEKEDFIALAAAFEYIAQWAKAMPEMQDSGEEMEQLWMGAMNAGGFPSPFPGQVMIRRPFEEDRKHLSEENGSARLLICWPDGYSYPVIPKAEGGYEVVEA